MNHKIPRALAEKQDRQRQLTINTILQAITELKAEGYAVRIKDLINYTGLSRSVFGKEHVRAILISQGVVSEKKCDPSPVPAKQSTEQRLRQILADKESRISQLVSENASLKNECELLRGRLFLLMQVKSVEPK